MPSTPSRSRLCLALAACTIFSCTDFPSSLSVPNFNVSLVVPLIDSTIQLDQFLHDNSSIIRDGDGNYSIVKEFNFPKVYLGDSLRIQSVNVNYSSSLNSNKVMIEQMSSMPQVRLSMDQFDSSLPREGDRIVEPIDRSVNMLLQMPEGVESVTFASGVLVLVLQNQLPIDIEIGNPPGYSSPGIVINTPGQKKLFCSVPSASQKLTRQGTANSHCTVRIPLQNSEFNTLTSCSFRAVSAGSKGSMVHYTNLNVFELRPTMENVEIAQARGRFDSKKIDFEFDAQLPVGTQITDGIIEEFAARLKLRNEFPLSGEATLTFPQLINMSSGLPFHHSFRLHAGTTEDLTLTNNSERYRCVPDAVDRSRSSNITSPHALCSVQTDANSMMSSFNSSQSLSIVGSITPIKFSSVRGLSSSQNTVRFSFSDDINSFDLGTLRFKQFSFQQMNLETNIVNDSDIEGDFSGTATLYDASGHELLKRTLDAIHLTKKNTTSNIILWEDLVLSAMPTQIKIEGTIIASSNVPYEISKSNTIHGTAKLTIPLSLTITDGEYSLADQLGLSGTLQSAKKHLESASLLIETRNRIPADVAVVVTFFDSSGTAILQLPKGEHLVIPASHATNSSPSTTRIVLDSTQTPLLTSAYRYVIQATFNTDKKAYALFRSSDSLRLRMSLDCALKTQ